MPEAPPFAIDLLVILSAGLFAGVICRRLGISLLVGYLLVGALLGQLPGLKINSHQIETLAETGVVLLLFSIGLEFSLEDLRRRWRFIVLGGAVQMTLVAGPVAAVVYLLGASWQTAALFAAAAALSSTVLVFKALAEWGQSASPHGRRAIGILLFQDAALVPLLLFVPLLTGEDAPAWSVEVPRLILVSAGLVAGVILLRAVLRGWVINVLAGLRSVELVVLSALVILTALTLAAQSVGLPLAIGAFGAGLVFGGNRLTAQVDALLLSFRETFAVVFFVSLGLLFDPEVLWDQPLRVAIEGAAVIALKAAAAMVALRITGLGWKTAAGMGIGLAQIGEFAFVLASAGVRAGVLGEDDYSRLLFYALLSLIITPLLIRAGLRWVVKSEVDSEALPWISTAEQLPKAVVVGAGSVGRQVSSQLDTVGLDVCVVDLSQVHLHPFEQLGFRTVTGDARDADVMRRSEATAAAIIVLCLPDDQATVRIASDLRAANPQAKIIARCHLLSSEPVLTAAGATAVCSEEAEVAAALVRLLERARRESPSRSS